MLGSLPPLDGRISWATVEVVEGSGSQTCSCSSEIPGEFYKYKAFPAQRPAPPSRDSDPVDLERAQGSIFLTSTTMIPVQLVRGLAFGKRELKARTPGFSFYVHSSWLYSLELGIRTFGASDFSYRNKDVKPS